MTENTAIDIVPLEETMAPYLEAIQRIPGDTAGEKYKWIGKLNFDRCQASGDLERFPEKLMSLLRVNRAIKNKIHEDVTSALRSEDIEIVSRALQATWFFDGSHKDVADVAYFREHLFHYVCLNTRTRILKRLALTGKDPAFAREMFTAAQFIYGLQQALPLLVACDEEFAYRTIVESRIELPYKLAKVIFRRNPDFIVRYLRLSKPRESFDTEDSNSRLIVNIKNYKNLLPQLVKKRLEAFVELYEMHEKNPPSVSLSNTATEMFLRNGMKYLTRKPLLYINILPLKKMNVTEIESIFPGLLPEDVSSYNVSKMLSYLEYYPENKKADLLCKTYRDKYGAELLDETTRITIELLLLLPTEERIRQARIKIERAKSLNLPDWPTCQNSWICYLSIEESIPDIKKKIQKAVIQRDRVFLLEQMIYACKVNKDDDALYDVLLYIKMRHKNEQLFVFDKIMRCLLFSYDLARLSEKLWSVINDIIQLPYVKYQTVIEQILKAMAHHRLLHDMPIVEPMEMLLEIKKKGLYVVFDCFYSDNRQYERHCLVTCLEIFRKKYNLADWKDNRELFVEGFVTAMYDFNDRCKRSRARIEPMIIGDYPWLMDAVRQMVWKLNNDRHYCKFLKDTLREKEPEFYNYLFPKSTVDIANVMTGAALGLLKRDPQSILNNWEAYLEVCKKKYKYKIVQRFVRSTRWYKDIPVKFMERCMDDLQLHIDETSSLAILAMLLDGESLTRLIDPLVPHEKTVDTSKKNAKDNYAFVHSLSFIMRLSNPPGPLDLVVRMCEGDYLSIALMIITNLSRRTSLPKVISFAQKLTEKRVSVQKHGIRTMYLVAAVRELSDFLLSVWLTENHHSTRGVLLERTMKFFKGNPCATTWSLLSTFIATLKIEDEPLLANLISEMKRSVSNFNEYVGKFIQLIFKTIDVLTAEGMKEFNKNSHIINILDYISPSYCNLLPDDFNEKLIRRYLFYDDEKVSEVAMRFATHSYLAADKKKYAMRVKVFADVFTAEVKSGWDRPHPKKYLYYPTNHIVHRFVNDLIINCRSKSIRTQVITDMLEIFLSVLTPQMDARSYLLLQYAKALGNSTSLQKYGLELGQKVRTLVEMFSPLLVAFMAETLEYFLENYCYQENIYEINIYEKNISQKTISEKNIYENKGAVMEGLIDAANEESCFVAAKILANIDVRMWNNRVRFDQIVERLLKMDYLSVRSILYDLKTKRIT